MRNSSTEIAHGVALDFVDLSRLVIVDDPVIAPLFVVGNAPIVRTVADQRILLTIVVRRTVVVEGEFCSGIAMRKSPFGVFLGLFATEDAIIL